MLTIYNKLTGRYHSLVLKTFDRAIIYGDYKLYLMIEIWNAKQSFFVIWFIYWKISRTKPKVQWEMLYYATIKPPFFLYH